MKRIRYYCNWRGSGGIATMDRAGEHGAAKAAVIEEKKLGEPVSMLVVSLKKSCGTVLRLPRPSTLWTRLALLQIISSAKLCCLKESGSLHWPRSLIYDGSFKRSGIELIEDSLISLISTVRSRADSRQTHRRCNRCSCSHPPVSRCRIRWNWWCLCLGELPKSVTVSEREAISLLDFNWCPPYRCQDGSLCPPRPSSP